MSDRINRKIEVVIYCYNGMTMLDAIGPYEVLRNVEDVKVKFVSKQRGELTADSKCIHINSKHIISEVNEADILIIPGATIAFVREMQDKELLEWIETMDAKTKYTISVCTGSMILAAAGLLRNRKATSHWMSVERLSIFDAIPSRERVVQSDKYITAAGVSAGIDMALYLVNAMKGEIASKAAQLAIEYDPRPPYQAGNYLSAEKPVKDLATKLLNKEAGSDRSLCKNLMQFFNQ